jgi:hypothetical protein
MTDGFARAAQGLATIRPPRLVRSAFGLLAAFLGRPAFSADFANNPSASNLRIFNEITDSCV